MSFTLRSLGGHIPIAAGPASAAELVRQKAKFNPNAQALHILELAGQVNGADTQLPDRALQLWELRFPGSNATGKVVGVEGLEPPTLGLEIRCSIRLSYTPSRGIGLVFSVMLHHSDRWGLKNLKRPAAKP